MVADAGNGFVIRVFKSERAGLRAGTDDFLVRGRIALGDELFTEIVEGRKSGENTILDLIAKEQKRASSHRSIPTCVRDAVWTRGRRLSMGEERDKVVQLGRNGTGPIQLSGKLFQEKAEHSRRRIIEPGKGFGPPLSQEGKGIRRAVTLTVMENGIQGDHFIKRRVHADEAKDTPSDFG